VTQNLHAEGGIAELFADDVPVLIHELEYYPEIAEHPAGGVSADDREEPRHGSHRARPTGAAAIGVQWARPNRVSEREVDTLMRLADTTADALDRVAGDRR
jgi:hypothetical protein